MYSNLCGAFTGFDVDRCQYLDLITFLYVILLSLITVEDSCSCSAPETGKIQILHALLHCTAEQLHHVTGVYTSGPPDFP